MAGGLGSMHGRSRRRFVVAVGILLASMAWGAVAVDAVPAGFTDPETVYSSLVFPTSAEFAPDGRVFIIEKRGTIKTARSLADPLSLMYDMTGRVHNYWDRGMLGLAVHPQYPSPPYIYVLYTHGVPLAVPGGPTAVWEQGADEICPNPPGGTVDGCVVSAQLARLRLNTTTMAVTEDEVLIHDWCQQFPSHSIGDLEFGADGYLYVSAGDGAAFHTTDYGQLGGSQTNTPTPANPCGDPPVAAGQAMPTDGSAQGGALRSQDLRTSGDPVTLSGTMIRIDPVPGSLLPPGNPNSGHPDPMGKLVVAYGLRNPFRFTVRPGTSELYIGDVGWNTWEEVNLHANPTAAVRNYGWPCYEGGNGTSAVLTSYSNLHICQGLYNEGSATAPFFAYRHNQTITHPTNDDCPPAEAGPTTRTSSSITGLAFYTSGGYPGTYDGALFGADYSRNCIWVMYPHADGRPDPATIEVFHYGPPTSPGAHGISPVDLEMGPDGNMYFVSYLHGRLYRFRYTGANTPPVAVISANPTSGAAPLEVTFDGTGSHDADGDSIVEYAWDFDNDGTFDAFGSSVTHTYPDPGQYTARLRVKDSRGETGTTTVTVQASNSPPEPVINTPAEGTRWSVGDTISFSGSATDPEEGTLPASRLEWNVILHHCAEDGSCHRHHIGTYTGQASGSFQAPNHEYPSHLELQLTATDQFGATATVSRLLMPRSVELTFATDPSGLTILDHTHNQARTAPFRLTAIVGSTIEVEAPTSQDRGGETWTFGSWSNGGPRRQAITAPASTTTYTASYAQVLGPSDAGDGFGVVDVTTGIWYLRDPGTGQTTSFYYGNPGDVPMMGDWNCDGVDTPGLYRQSDGFVYLRNSNTQGIAHIRFFFGNPGDFPIAGDFNGNGCDTVSIHRPSEARFYIINKLGQNGGGLGAAEFSYVFGNQGDKPFSGDFNGDGIDTMGLHRESTGLVYFRNSHTQGVADKSFVFGNPGDRMFAGNWAVSGAPGPDTVGVFRPSNRTIYLKFTNTPGVADYSLVYGRSQMWPVAGRFGNLPGGSPPP